MKTFNALCFVLRNRIIKHLFTSLLFLCCINTKAQNVAINNTGALPNNSAMLDVTSNNSGMLIPRMSSLQRMAIVSPAIGLTVYDLSTQSFWFFNGTIWIEITSSSTGWLIAGNNLTADGIFGSLTPFNVKHFSNGIERMRLDISGVFGIGTTAPATSFLGSSAVDKLNVHSATTPAGCGMVEFSNANSNGLVLLGSNLSTTNGYNGLGVAHEYTGNTYAPSAIIGQVSTSNGTGTGIAVRGNGFSSTHIGVGGSIPTTTGSWTGFGGLFSGGLAYVNGIYNVSDKRVKKDIQKISNPLKIVTGLNGVYYKYNTEIMKSSKGDNKTYIGFIAQEVEDVCPEIVANKLIDLGFEELPKINEPQKSNTMIGKVVDYVQLIPVLVEAIKEQQQQIEKLKFELKELKKKK
ncbi:MAG: tail fiber domain-containing protein [Bacteroidetes bacterium]|nr:tail fiber domain-containing protein [Bacteroidota bacterium]